MAMSMLFVTDLHYALRQFDWLAANAARYDPVIIGGDLLDLGASLDLDVQIVVVQKYLSRIRQITRLVVSSGNHDGDSRNPSGESVVRWIHEAKAPEVFVDGDCHDLTGSLLTVRPWWDGPVSRGQLEALLARDAAKPKVKWVWIHHAPPDQSRVSWTGKKFGGDEFLVEWIRTYQPDLVLSGHIHNAPFYPDGSWVDRLGKTWVFNPGKQLGPQPTYLAIDLEKMTAAWLSAEGSDLRHLVVPPVTAPTPLSGAAADA